MNVLDSFFSRKPKNLAMKAAYGKLYRILNPVITESEDHNEFDYWLTQVMPNKSDEVHFQMTFLKEMKKGDLLVCDHSQPAQVSYTGFDEAGNEFAMRRLTPLEIVMLRKKLKR